MSNNFKKILEASGTNAKTIVKILQGEKGHDYVAIGSSGWHTNISNKSKLIKVDIGNDLVEAVYASAKRGFIIYLGPYEIDNFPSYSQSGDERFMFVCRELIHIPSI